MGKTGRTRARNRWTNPEGHRQPDFTRTPVESGTSAPVEEDETLFEDTPPDRRESGQETEGQAGRVEHTLERAETHRGGVSEQGDTGERRGGDECVGEQGQGAEEESEEVSLSEESEDSEGRKGEEKERRIYWKEVGKK
eukprot:5545326-Pleurochrysis_carterae.AAC.1